MRNPSLIAILLIVAFATSTSIVIAQDPAAAPGTKKSNHVKIKFDKGKNLTTVSLKPLDLGGSMAKEVSNLAEVSQLDLDGSFTFEGEALKKQVDAITLNFKVLARYPVFQRGQNLVGVLNDESALLLGATGYKSNSQTFRIEEILTISVPYEAMKKISAAKSVKFVLGAREIKLREKDHEALRDVTRLMAPAS